MLHASCQRAGGWWLAGILLWAVSIALLPVPSPAAEPASQQQEGKARGTEPPSADQPDEKEWQPLFDGRTLRNWKSTQFGGEGEVTVEDGQIILGFGASLTGVTYTGELPKMNYEVALEAMRLDGTDFFCGLTFPVAESHCSLIVGGWAGGVVGLSSIDGKDASENNTTRYMLFESNRWYPIRVRVTPTRIAAWIDDKQVVDQSIEGRRLSTRIEVGLSEPLGIASYETRAALRNIRLRRLSEDEIAAQAQGK